MSRAQIRIDELELSAHPEGGFYKEIYRAPDKVILPTEAEEGKQSRAAATLIYFLMLKNNFSAFHRIKSDEIWNYIEGGSVTIHMIDPASKEYRQEKLGSLSMGGCSPIVIVPSHCWFAAEVAENQDYSLVNCFVAPGFEFSDFELAHQETLIKDYPEYADIITRLTRRSF